MFTFIHSCKVQSFSYFRIDVCRFQGPTFFGMKVDARCLKEGGGVLRF